MDYTIFDSLQNPQGRRIESSWGDLIRSLENVKTYPAKNSQPLIKLGVFDRDSRAVGSKLTSISGVEIDYDDGQIAVSSVANILQSANIECVVCSTYTSTPKHPKWRVFAPTRREIDGALRQYLAGALDGAIGNIAAPESYRPKQTFFVGRNPDAGYNFIHVAGGFVDVVMRDQANEAYRASRQARAAISQSMRMESRRAAGVTLTSGQLSPVSTWNETYTVHDILTRHGYQPIGGKYLAPTSSSCIPGVIVLQADDGRERVFSHHSNDPLADGLAHDSFDLFRILEHGGNHKAAVEAASVMLVTNAGLTLQAHNRAVWRQSRA